jgi:hypothetical protein
MAGTEIPEVVAQADEAAIKADVGVELADVGALFVVAHFELGGQFGIEFLELKGIFFLAEDREGGFG